MLDEVFAVIHIEDGLAGVHCCGNTDWSLLLDSQVDIVSLDACSYMEQFSLYPVELKRFIGRGGVIA